MTMVRGVFITAEVEHPGDIETYRSIIIDNGGEVEKVNWEEDNDCIIVFRCVNKEQRTKIKEALDNGL